MVHFKSNPTVFQEIDSTNQSQSTSTDINENLFIDPIYPESNEQITINQENDLVDFLERDFKSLGYKDGYKYHSTDVLENYKQIIRCEFIEIICSTANRVQAKRSELRNCLIDVKQISIKSEEKLNYRIKELDNCIENLHKEKELARVNNGLIAKIIYTYHDGFIRGVEDYTEEKLLMTY